jgi:hypothetical protein
MLPLRDGERDFIERHALAAEYRDIPQIDQGNWHEESILIGRRGAGFQPAPPASFEISNHIPVVLF